MTCSYSTQISDNAVEIPNKCCPKGSTKHILLFVACHLLRITKLHSKRLEQNVFRMNKIYTAKFNALYLLVANFTNLFVPYSREDAPG